MRFILLLLISLGMYGSLFAQNLQIIPTPKESSNVPSSVEQIWVWWQVWDKYNERAVALSWDLWAQMASGVFTWDTLLDYLAYLIKFLSEVGIFVWACFIVYAWYLYATSIFSSDSWATSKWNTAIKNAIIWIIVITFSYAIMKAITAAFLT